MTDPATAWLVIALAFLLTLGILAIACAVTADDLPAPPDPDDWWHDGADGIVWRDDAQVVEQYVCKLFGEPARCELHVAPTEAA